MAQCLHCDYKGDPTSLCPKCGRPMALRKLSLAEFQSLEFLMILIIPVGVVIAILFPVVTSAGGALQATSKISEIQRISLSLLEYTSDNDDRFPPFVDSDDVTDKLADRYKNQSLEQSSRAMTWNLTISAKKTKELPKGDQTWLISCPNPGSKDYTLFALLDGHGRSASNKAFDEHYK